MSNVQLAQLVVQCVSALMVLLGLLFTSRQLRLLRKTYVDLHDWNRRKAAQDASHEWQGYADDAVLLENTFHFREKQGVVDLAALLATFSTDTKAQASLHRILNYFEAIANGTRNGVFDEPIIRDAFCGVFDLHAQRFGAYIDHRRSHGAPKAWIEMEDLSQKWQREDRSRVARASTGAIGP
jgi:hypothetical protein